MGKYGGRHLVSHVLAVWEMAQVSLLHLCLPQTQLSIKGPDCSVHVRDDVPPILQLQFQ